MKPKQPVELWIQKDEAASSDGDHGTNPRYHEIFTVGFGDREIEVTFTDAEAPAADWVRETHRLHRHSPRRTATSPLLAGVSAFYGRELSYSYRGNPKPDPSIAVVSICAGGDRCLVIPVSLAYYCCYKNDRHALPFAVRGFLVDAGVSVVGVGVKKLAERLERHWGFKMGEKGKEVREVVEAAFGKDAVRRPGGLEEMAEVALGGVKVGKKPGRLVFNAWLGEVGGDEEEVLHAAVDAFMAREIGSASMEVVAAAAAGGRRRR